MSEFVRPSVGVTVHAVDRSAAVAAVRHVDATLINESGPRPFISVDVAPGVQVFLDPDLAEAWALRVLRSTELAAEVLLRRDEDLATLRGLYRTDQHSVLSFDRWVVALKEWAAAEWAAPRRSLEDEMDELRAAFLADDTCGDMSLRQWINVLEWFAL
jgi:hypothetical protein